MGQLWGGLFFLFMTFASFSTVTAVFESLIGNCMDNFGWSRKKSVLILLPLVFFCTTRYGWGFDKYMAEVNMGTGVKMPRWVKPYFKYVLPILIFGILVRGLL